MFTEPITGEKFFGRREVLDLLNKRVSALKEGYRQNVALTGPSLAGKSSIILHFLDSVKDEGFVPVYIEVIKEDFTKFANKFIATLLYNCLRRMGEDFSLDIGYLLDKAGRALPKTSQNIRQVYSMLERNDSEGAYLGLLNLTSAVKNETGLSCLVILDEFDNLEHLGVKNPFLGFGKVIMVQKDTMYIVSSSRNESIKKIISEKLSLLFGNFEVVKVRNFDNATSNEFLNMRFAGFEVKDTIRKFLISFTGGNPFYLDRLTQEAENTARREMSGYIDAPCVSKSILRLVYSAGGSINQYLYNYLLSLLDTRNRDYYLSMLTAISLGRNKAMDIARFVKSKQSDTSKSLTRLLELGLLSKNGVFYEIEDGMLCFWLKYVYSRKREILVDGSFDKMEMFAQDIRGYIERFENECARPPESRIVDLFNAFSNELVTIDAKSFRLPHFTRVEIKPGGESGAIVAASFRGKAWTVQAYASVIDENDVISYIKGAKQSANKVSNRIIISLAGIEENAKLLAKELKISIWDGDIFNSILGYYGKERMIELQ